MLSSLLLLFALQATALSPHGEKAVVLLFIRTDCPVSNRYAPELQRLYNKYSPQGIDFLLVYPESGLTAADMQQHDREYGYTIPSVLDPTHEYVARAKARTTPEGAVFVAGKVVYLGRIDDWYVDIGKARPQPTTHDLDNELAAIVAGKIPEYHETRSVGCAIEDLK